MIIRRLLMLGFLFAPATAWAELPPCFAQLEHAPPDGVLSSHQNDVNNNCLRELQTASVAADLAAHIAESERKRHAPVPTVTQSTLPMPLGGMPVAGTGLPVLPQSLSPPPPVQAALPRIVMIVSDGNRYVATLRLANGGTTDAIRGATLPDGTRVAAVTASTVYLQRGKTLVPLSDDDGTSPTPTTGQDQTFPGMMMQRPGAATGRAFP